MQVDFSKAAIIIRVATQGRQDYRQWVTQYYLRHSVDGVYFVDYKQRNSRKVFQKNFKNHGYKHEGYKCLIVVLNIGISPLTHQAKIVENQRICLRVKRSTVNVLQVL